jgi:glycosyltransferase involved in cell wall biosynthesis
VRRANPAIRSLALVHRAIPNRRRSMDKWLNRGFLVRNNGYIVLNEEVERDLWQLGLRAPIRQIPHPIFDRFGDAQPRAEARDRLGIASDTPLLLFFGSVRPHKGLNVLLESVAVARRRLPELRLIIAGEFDENEAGYRSQIADLGIARAVDIRNEYVPDADVATLFGASDAVVQPGVKAPQRGIAPVAFHFGRPLILTDLGNFARVVQECDGGLVVPPGDPDALAEAIETFFTEDLADELAAGVRARRHEFSWDGLVEAIEELDEAVR